MIFYRSHPQTFATESLYVNVNEDVLAAIKAFEPEFIRAQTSGDNPQVLQAASHSWAGVGLIEPNAEQIQQAQTLNHRAKVFLLSPNDLNLQAASECALAVHDENSYSQECLAALNNVLT